jgi:hypothetical protein
MITSKTDTQGTLLAVEIAKLLYGNYKVHSDHNEQAEWLEQTVGLTLITKWVS